MSLGFHFQQFVEKLLQQTVKSSRQLVLHRLSIEQFDSVDPSCLFLRGYTVTSLRLIFVRSLVVRLRDPQTIRDHEEDLLASEEECKKSRRASVPVDRWS